MKFVYPAVFYPCEEGGFTVEVPDLSGCVSEGDTLEEAIEMGVDAASGWILGEWEAGRKIPAPRDFARVKAEEGGATSLLLLDMAAYAEKYGSKAVRKNLTIPAWLNTFAEVNNINFSKVLQDALSGLAVAYGK